MTGRGPWDLRVAETESYDLLVIGGGINGAGIARDAAGRGLSVLLCERDDLANATSSASSKLIHGGLRYLEQYRFALVRKALIEREVLLRAAPHIVRPLRFVLPWAGDQRPAWLLRMGLFIYDHIGGRRLLPGSGAIDLGSHPAGAPLVPGMGTGFEFFDCRVDDARLVVLSALDAAERGAQIRTRTRYESAARDTEGWTVTLRPPGGGRQSVRARALVNAAGAWVPRIAAGLDGAGLGNVPMRLIKGSHIVVPRLYDGDHAYLLQNSDGRVVFVLPFEEHYSLIGTTDVEFTGDPAVVETSRDEIDYLCQVVGRYFTQPIDPANVVWTYSGVRPLFGDAAVEAPAVSREYLLDMDLAAGAPLLSVHGGKITTYRRLAEEALTALARPLQIRKQAWTRTAPLPGGDMKDADFDRFYGNVTRRWPWLPPDLARRYARAYGTRIERLLSGVRDMRGLGAHFGGGLYEAEVGYLVDREWARTADDILWRRSKLGLHLSPEAAGKLSAWLERNAARP